MPSWVRYSVTVYVGLLLAGSLGGTRPEASGSPDSSVPAVSHQRCPNDQTKTPGCDTFKAVADAKRPIELSHS